MTGRILRSFLIFATLLVAVSFAWLAPAAAEENRGCGDLPAELEATEGEAGEIDTLGEALERLRREGLRILYTSRLVDASAPLDEFPCAGSPEERLRALLAPLGLAARAASDGQFVVGLGPAGELDGTVRGEPGGEVIAFARVRLLPDDEVLSERDGRFRLRGVPAGWQVVEISRPGYITRRWRMRFDAGQRRRLDVTLRLDAEASDEILVGAVPEDLPLGTWRSASEPTRDALAIEQDVLAAASRLPGTSPGPGVAFGVRGHEAERLTVVVDGIEVAEPYHFRHLGSLAGAVTPDAVDEFRLHRGSPPVVYGDRAGGVLEVVTESESQPFSARLGLGDESTRAKFGGIVQGLGLRWLAAYRLGEPEQPPAGADLDRRPAYWDGLAKLTFALHPRHELTLQTLQVSDELSTLLGALFLRELTIDQESRYSQLRYLGTLARHHVLEVKISRSEIERRRFGRELLADILAPPQTDENFVLDDRRTTQGTTGHVDAVWSPRDGNWDGLEWRWGAELEDESTTYDYQLFAPFLRPELPPPHEAVIHSAVLDQEELGLYSQVTWRPRAGTTLSGGLRFDDGDLADGSALVPRLGASFRAGAGVWRFGWARVHDSPGTHELLLADGEQRPPGTETSDYVTLGYRFVRGAHGLSFEVYDQRIENPRLRFENLFQSIGRVPELELDRHRVEAEASRSQGLEVRYDYRTSRLRASATYELSRFEDRLSHGAWRPRRSDRRHAVHLSLAARLPFDIDADLLWRSASGQRTTPLEIELASRDFAAALGRINSRRLPAMHRLDLRLSRSWRILGRTLRAAIGVDDLFDRQNVTGLDLLPLRDPDGPPSELPLEGGLGRTLRWSLELSW